MPARQRLATRELNTQPAQHRCEDDSGVSTRQVGRANMVSLMGRDVRTRASVSAKQRVTDESPARGSSARTSRYYYHYSRPVGAVVCLWCYIDQRDPLSSAALESTRASSHSQAGKQAGRTHTTESRARHGSVRSQRQIHLHAEGSACCEPGHLEQHPSSPAASRERLAYTGSTEEQAQASVTGRARGRYCEGVRDRRFGRQRGWRA